MPDLRGAHLLGQEMTLSKDEEYIAQIIEDYEPTLELQHIPPESLFPGQRPYRIICKPGTSPDYVVMYSDTCDQRLLERLFKADNTRTNVLTDLEAHEMATKLMSYKRWMEENESAADQMAHAMASPLNTYKYHNSEGDLVTLRN